MQDSSSPEASSFRSPDLRQLAQETNEPGLAAALHSLLSAPTGSNEARDSLERVAYELKSTRSELELQNRMLREFQSELELALRRYTDLYDSLPIGYVTLTLEGRIVESNQTAADLLHGDRGKLAGCHLSQFLPASNGAALAGHLAACAGSDARHSLEVTLEPRGGVPFFAQLSSRRTVPAEGQVLIRTTLTDISSIKETQHSLEEIITEQEGFAYSISHDLRSPLLTISNFSLLLTDDSVTLDVNERRDILGRIQRAATRMDQLLNNLLDYTRVSRHPMRLEPLSVDEVLREVIEEHAATIRSRSARLSVQSPLPRVVGSRTLLNQACDHLLSNALKYTTPGHPPAVRITAEEKEKTIVLTVADEGIGIPLQHHDRIFRIFERLHSQSAYPGTGIGLALVRRAAERMHGRVWVESDGDRGCRFHLELPRPDAGAT